MRIIGKSFLLVMLTLMTSCASYHHGTDSKLASIYIAPVKNSSLFPNLSGALTNALVHEIQSKTAIKIVGKQIKSVRLLVEISRYGQKEVVTDAEDTSRSLAWEQNLEVIFSLYDADGAIMIDQQKVTVTTDLEMKRDFLESKDFIAASLAERAARKIVAFVAHAW